MSPELNQEEPLPHSKCQSLGPLSLISEFGLARVREKALKWINRQDSYRRSIQHSI